jgi:hypothetical protein
LPIPPLTGLQTLSGVQLLKNKFVFKILFNRKLENIFKINEKKLQKWYHLFEKSGYSSKEIFHYYDLRV